ncbi:MAG: hypothetical protein JST90_11325 [Bacteroidetes bacterium]|nr:hypothetical protein [Bacteroidota bacterium]
MTVKQFILFILVLSGLRAAAQSAVQIGTRIDTAVVRSYYRVPVFYHCRPLRSYQVLGMMTATPMVAYSSKAFEHYTHMARRRYKDASIGILVNDLNFGTDSFYVVRFAPDAGRTDTAVFETPIFLGARPTRPYKVIRVINDQLSCGSLNQNLQRYMREAASLHLCYDGIMVRDINYAFTPDEIYIFRWKNTPAGHAH